MNVITHDPSEYIRGIQQILISDKKRIGLLFGAGTSLANKNLCVPAIDKMTTEIVNKVGKIEEKYKTALEEIKHPPNHPKYNVYCMP